MPSVINLKGRANGIYLRAAAKIRDFLDAILHRGASPRLTSIIICLPTERGSSAFNGGTPTRSAGVLIRPLGQWLTLRRALGAFASRFGNFERSSV
jgi:hypothetical protein